MESEFTVGRSVINQYVKSLYDVSVSAGIEKTVLNQLKALRSCILSIKNYGKYLKRVSLITEQGERFIDILKTQLELSRETGNFLSLLLKNERFPLIVQICDAYFSFCSKANGERVFLVNYADNFTKSDERKLASLLKKIFGGKIRFVSRKDPELIGGISVQSGSKILDYSLRSRLSRLHCTIRGDKHEN
ncbi:MAG: ATP synthase F1 subunit delta [Holosporaceae bacterium]|jgi:F-type H+-transporting ATPase subunit delta|nr:ATP synthase F1 subunit delta [Holosporaceae bacterium]